MVDIQCLVFLLYGLPIKFCGEYVGGPFLLNLFSVAAVKRNPQ